MWSSVAGIMQALRYSLGQLRKAPGFAAVVIVTLALGIGANTAVFSVMDVVLLRALPVRDPQQLVYLHTSDFPGGQTGYGDTSMRMQGIRGAAPGKAHLTTGRSVHAHGSIGCNCDHRRSRELYSRTPRVVAESHRDFEMRMKHCSTANNRIGRSPSSGC